MWDLVYWKVSGDTHLDSPHDQACDDGGPGDAAGLRPLGVFIDVFAAAA